MQQRALDQSLALARRKAVAGATNLAPVRWPRRRRLLFILGAALIAWIVPAGLVYLLLF